MISKCIICNDEFEVTVYRGRMVTHCKKNTCRQKKWANKTRRQNILDGNYQRFTVRIIESLGFKVTVENKY